MPCTWEGNRGSGVALAMRHHTMVCRQCRDPETCPQLFEVEGSPCVLPPTFGGRTKNCCHRMSDFKAKIHQILFRLGLHFRLRWGSLLRFLRPLARFNGTYF